MAVQILPPSQWHHMRGGQLPSGDLLAVPASDPPSHFRSSSGCVVGPHLVLLVSYSRTINPLCMTVFPSAQQCLARSTVGMLI